MNAPEITVEELAGRLHSPDPFILLDVREDWEIALASIVDARLQIASLNRLAEAGLPALPASARRKEAQIYVLCHHGLRSAQVTSWLASQGWSDVHSVRGGIDLYARRIDPAVGLY